MQPGDPISTPSIPNGKEGACAPRTGLGDPAWAVPGGPPCARWWTPAGEEVALKNRIPLPGETMDGGGRDARSFSSADPPYLFRELSKQMEWSRGRCEKPRSLGFENSFCSGILYAPRMSFNVHLGGVVRRATPWPPISV